MMHNYYLTALSILLLFLQTGCKNEEQDLSPVNSDHLDHIYQEYEVEGKTVGIVHIYCEYPDYKYVGDDDEGIACVDDAARAAVFYLREYQQFEREEDLIKAKNLLEFLSIMQSPNNYFYNFIWEDGSIHKGGITTVAEPNWWSWRALWTFGEALNILGENEKYLSQINRLIETIEPLVLVNGSDTFAGFPIPNVLPDSAAADQASILLAGLNHFYSKYPKDNIKAMMIKLADGILEMQIKDPGSPIHGAFRSWKNVWHAYGNLQSYALLLTHQNLGIEKYKEAALLEIEKFYPSFMDKGGMSHFIVKRNKGQVIVTKEAVFPQIAYNYRPMIWASLKAYELTGNHDYLETANQLASWFSGNNPVKSPMYSSSTGRCFDGIIDAQNINKNAGAESTIEALLALQAIEMVKN